MNKFSLALSSHDFAFPAMLTLVVVLLSTRVLGFPDMSLFQGRIDTVEAIRSTMLGSIRTSWEQGTAAGAILEWNDPEYSIFGSYPFASNNGTFPRDTLQLAYSAAVRQTPDGRLSQNINDGLDGAALDGASAGSAVLMGTFTDPSRKSYWEQAADAQLNYVLNVAPRTKTGAISSRATTKQYWADGMYMGFPFIAYYGAVKKNGTLLQIAYDQCKLYRDALLIDGPTGKLWAHIYDDDNSTWVDEGIWATGNGWAALAMLRVAVTIQKTPFYPSMTPQVLDLLSWVKEILDGEFRALNSDNLLPDYLTCGPNFGDASSSAALASVAYRAATLFPDQFDCNYTNTAGKIRAAIWDGVTNLGTLSPVVNPLAWNETGLLSTEAQGFGLMMLSAWRDWIWTYMQA
ncbi:hypothetical protein SCLCIDRAFT_1214918 [Scleroderma citrinum Foug A]|uniref:Glycoside hydrolase family 105 protein n=1 Tax=Scleroderma citrinum Foug A TaxID=1036808 RepID=A0A0C3ACB8_9AGAM|nr:hypothetical protein SCLCIDRAFT_1214918 [Scleroderma citrinum Foug A]